MRFRPDNTAPGLSLSSPRCLRFLQLRNDGDYFGCPRNSPAVPETLDPVSRAIANAPYDDEPESEDERRAVAESKAWLAQHPGQTISHAEMMAEFGLSADDLKG